MPDNSTAPSPQPDPHDAIVAALNEGGPRTAGQLAEYMGVAYSTLTPRLRQLEEQGRTERIKDPVTRQTLWQMTAAAPPCDIAVGNRPDSQTTLLDDTASADGDDADAPAIANGTEPGDKPSYHATEDAAEDDNPIDVADEGTDGDGDTMGAQVTADSNEPDDEHKCTDDSDPAIPSVNGDSQTPTRRQKGAITAAILDVTRANPDDTFKVSQLKKALDGASAGAIANAATKLVVSGELICVCEKPATYQAA